MMNGILTKARWKGIKTLMRRRNICFRKAQRLQASRIIEAQQKNENKKEKRNL